MKPQISGKAFDVECNFGDTEDGFEYPVEGYTAIGLVDPKDTPQGRSGQREATQNPESFPNMFL